jgi:hypothetical protein
LVKADHLSHLQPFPDIGKNKGRKSQKGQPAFTIYSMFAEWDALGYFSATLRSLVISNNE